MSASSLRQRGAVAAVVATALLVTACGGGSSSGAAAAGGSSSTSAAAAAATSAAGAAATSAAGAAAPTSGAAATSKIVVPSAAAVTSVKATGGGDFCKSLAAAINTSAASTPGTTPAEIKKSFTENEANAIKALSKAPSEIKPEIQILVDTSAKLVAALAKVNYDFTKITPADEAALDSPTFTAAETKVAAYVKAHCGFDIGGGASASS